MIDHKIDSLSRVDQSNDRMIDWPNRMKSNERKQEQTRKTEKKKKKKTRNTKQKVYILRMNTQTNSIMQAIQWKECRTREMTVGWSIFSLFSQPDYVATESE